MYILEVDAEFSAAHFLRNYRGRCENLHGHNWRVRLSVAGSQLDEAGMLADFGLLRRWLREETEALDHRPLNETGPFDALNPTSEHIARHLAERLAPRMPAGVRLECVRVWETDRASAAYFPGH